MNSGLLTPPVLVVSIIFGSTLIRAAVGFGNALVAMPLLILVIGSDSATPLVALLGLVTAVLMLIREWRQIDLRAAWQLVLSTLVGIPLGLYFLNAAPEVVIRWVLGLVLIAFGLYNLLGPRLPRVRGPWVTLIFGLWAGVLGGAYNSNGPPVVIYGVMRDWKPEQFRATLQGYFLVTGVAITLVHGLAGMWTAYVLRLFVFSLPAVLGAVLLGGWGADRIPEHRFQALVYGFLVVVGGLLILA